MYMWRYKNLYQCVVKDKKWDNSSSDVWELPNKKIGFYWRRYRSIVSGICMLSLWLWITCQHFSGYCIAEGILISRDANILASYSGGTSLIKDWFIGGKLKWWGSGSKAKVTVEKF